MRIDSPEMLTSVEVREYLSCEGQWVALSFNGHGGAIFVVSQMEDGDYKDYYLQLMALAEERDALAAQVEVMRDALATAEGWIIIPDGNCSCHISPPCSSCIDKGNAEFDDEQIKAALALPNTSAAILRQRDARTLREAAQACYAIAVTPCDSAKHSLFNMGVDKCARALCAKAEDMEAQP